MKPYFRLALFWIAAPAFAALWIAAVARLSPADAAKDRYLLAVTSQAFAQRHVTDAVSAVNFDYRAIDTLGEEFIFFASVLGSLVLLRQADEKRSTLLPDGNSPARILPPSDAVKFWLFIVIASLVSFGIYTILHGQLTPGGGFQGGVIVASAALVVYLCLDFKAFKRIMTHPFIEIVEALGAAAFVAIGTLGLFAGKPFLTNTLPPGAPGNITSGGTIPLVSAAVGIEIAGGILLLIYAFLQELLIREES